MKLKSYLVYVSKRLFKNTPDCLTPWPDRLGGGARFLEEE